MTLPRINTFVFITITCLIIFTTLYSQAVEALPQSKAEISQPHKQSKSKPLRIALHPLNFSQYQQQHKNGSEMSEMISSLLMIELGKNQQFELLGRSLIPALLTEKVHLLVNDDLNTNQAIFKKLPISDFTLVGSLFSSGDSEFFSLKLVNNSSGQILGAARLPYTIDTLQDSIQQAYSLIQQWTTQAPLTTALNAKKIAFGHFIDISASDTMLNQGREITESLIEQFVNEKKQVVLSRTQMFPLVFEEYLRTLQYTEENQSLQRQNTDYFIHGKYRVNDANSKKSLSIYLYFDMIKYGRELVVLQAENWEQAYALIHRAIADLLPKEAAHISIENIEASNQLLLEALQVRGTIPKINLRNVLAGKHGPRRGDIENFFFSAKKPEKLAPARKLIEQALEKNPDNSFANLILALFFETEGDIQRSREIINKVLRQKDAMSVGVAFEMLQSRKQDLFSRINEKTFTDIVGTDQSNYVYQWLIKNKYLFNGGADASLSCSRNPRIDQIINLSHTVLIDTIEADTSIQVLELLRSICYSPGLQVKYSKPRSRHRLYKNKRNWLQSSYRDKHNAESVMHFDIGKTASLMRINNRSSLPTVEFFDEVAFESKERRHANLEISADAFASSVYIDTSYLKAKFFLGYSLCQEDMPRCAAGNIIHSWVVDQTKAANLKSAGGMYFNVTKDIEEKDRLIFLAADAVNRVHEANFTKMFQNTLVREKYHVKQAEKNLISLSENEQNISSESDIEKSALSYAKLIKTHCTQLTKRQRKLGLWAPLEVTKPMDALATLALQNNKVALIRKALLADLETNCSHVYPHLIIRASAVAPFVVEEQDDIINKVAAGKVVPFKISRFMKIVLEVFEARVDSQKLETAKQYIQYLTDYYRLTEKTAMDFAYLYDRIGDSKTSDSILRDYGKTAFKVSHFSRLKVDGDYTNKGFNHNGLLKFVNKENSSIFFLYGVHRAQYGLAEIPVKWGLTTGDKQSYLISGNKNPKHPAAFGFGNGGEYFGEIQWTAPVLIKATEKGEATDSKTYPEIELLKQEKLSFPEQSLKRNMPGSYFIDIKNKTSISGFPRRETAGPLLDSYFSDSFAKKIKLSVIKEALFKKGYLTSAGVPVDFGQDLPKRLQKDFPEYSRDLRRTLGNASHIKESGVVQVYQQKGDAWEIEVTLIPEDAIKQRYFGLATAISGQYALICDNKDGIYSYRKINNQWLQQQRIESACNKIVMNDEWAVIGAKEKAFVYKNNDGFWQKTQTLIPKNYLINKDKRYNFDRFAHSLAIYKNTLAVGNALGGIYEKGKVDRRGEVYLFTLNNNQWQQSEIINPKQSAYYFGESIVLTNRFMLIGDTSTGGDFNSATQGSGSVFIYSKDKAHWQLNAQLVAKGKPRQERFGQQLLLIDDSVLIKSFKYIYRYPLNF